MWNTGQMTHPRDNLLYQHPLVPCGLAREGIVGHTIDRCIMMSRMAGHTRLSSRLISYGEKEVENETKFVSVFVVAQYAVCTRAVY